MFVPNQVEFTHSICLSVTAGVGLLDSGYLVRTPHTVLSLFSTLWTLSFSDLRCIDSGYLVIATPREIFENFAHVFSRVCRSACGLDIIFKFILGALVMSSAVSLPNHTFTGQASRTWNVRKEGYIPHGKLRTFTCGGLRSIGTLCPLVYASWKFFLCGRPQYFHMQVRSCPQRGPRKSADICGHLCGRLCGRPHGLVWTSAWIGADVRMDGCGCLRTSAWMGADIRRARGSVRVAPPAV